MSIIFFLLQLLIWRSLSGKQVWIILQRTLNTVRKEPTQIVTALRIVEREERADQFALQVHFVHVCK